MIVLSMEPETILYMIGGVVGVVAVVATYRGEVLSRKPNVDLADFTKRIDGVYEHLLSLSERMAKVETTLEATMVDKDPEPEPEPQDEEVESE